MRGIRSVVVLSLGLLLGAAVPADKLPPPDEKPPVAPPAPDPLLPPPPPLFPEDRPPPPEQPTPPPRPVSDAEMVERAGLKTDADALLAFFRRRTLPEGERAGVAALIRQLGALEYDDRAGAADALVERGP